MLKSLFRRSVDVGPSRPTAAGRSACVPPGVCVYAVGDIHGRVDLLSELHRLIAEDASHLTPGTEKLVVYVGDYVDRGMESRQVVDLLLDLPLPGFTAVHLLGNHDAWLLSFLVDAQIGPTWLRYGGDATLHSYGVSVGLQRDDAGIYDKLQADLRERVPRRHVDFLQSLELSYETGDFLFVHAGVRPTLPLDRQTAEDLLLDPRAVPELAARPRQGRGPRSHRRRRSDRPQQSHRDRYRRLLDRLPDLPGARGRRLPVPEHRPPDPGGGQRARSRGRAAGSGAEQARCPVAEFGSSSAAAATAAAGNRDDPRRSGSDPARRCAARRSAPPASESALLACLSLDCSRQAAPLGAALEGRGGLPAGRAARSGRLRSAGQSQSDDAGPAPAPEQPAQGAADLRYEVTIEGVDDDALRGLLQQVSETQRLIDRPPPSIARLRRRAQDDRPRLLEVLRSEGYYGGQVEVALDSSVQPIKVTFRIDLGPVYRLGSVSIEVEPPEPGLSVPSPRGDRPEAGRARRCAGPSSMPSRPSWIGCARRASSWPSLGPRRAVVDHDTDLMDLTLRIQPGPLSRFGPVTFDGLSTVEQDFVANRLDWQQGELITPARLEEARNSLRETGLFTSVQIDLADTTRRAGPAAGDGRPDRAQASLDRARRALPHRRGAGRQHQLGAPQHVRPGRAGLGRSRRLVHRRVPDRLVPQAGLRPPQPVAALRPPARL